MIIDCHVHISAFTPGHGAMSRHLQNTWPFRLMRGLLGMVGSDAQTELQVENLLTHLLAQTPQIDAAVVLAFDAVYSEAGEFDARRTHLWVTNDYAAEMVARHPKMLLGASINPYRRDAVAEVERCVKLGAVLLKWLPSVQGFDPANEKCIPFYEVLAHFNLPLLSHTGGEKSLPRIDDALAHPNRLKLALDRGVTVIAAHCGTKSFIGEADWFDDWAEMALAHEKFYGDTAALNLPGRWGAWRWLLKDNRLRAKLVHGSDWPIMALPNPRLLGVHAALELMEDGNWLRRDVKIKQQLGLDDAYFHRGGTILRLPSPVPLP